MKRSVEVFPRGLYASGGGGLNVFRCSESVIEALGAGDEIVFEFTVWGRNPAGLTVTLHKFHGAKARFRPGDRLGGVEITPAWVPATAAGTVEPVTVSGPFGSRFELVMDVTGGTAGDPIEVSVDATVISR